MDVPRMTLSGTLQLGTSPVLSSLSTSSSPRKFSCAILRQKSRTCFSCIARAPFIRRSCISNTRRRDSNIHRDSSNTRRDSSNTRRDSNTHQDSNIHRDSNTRRDSNIHRDNNTHRDRTRILLRVRGLGMAQAQVQAQGLILAIVSMLTPFLLSGYNHSPEDVNYGILLHGCDRKLQQWETMWVGII